MLGGVTLIGYIDYFKYINTKDGNTIVDRIRIYYPQVEQSQVDSWYELINILQNTPKINQINDDVVLGIEYSLPVDFMTIA